MIRVTHLLLLLINSAVCLQAHALSWKDLWSTPDQQAQLYYQQGQHKQAERLFTRQDWQGMAAYRQGKFAAAEKQFQAYKDPLAYYNLGNALAKQGKYQQALDVYQKSLALAPKDQDALFNRDLMKQLLKQQKSSNKQQNKKNQQGKKKQQKQDKQQSKQGQKDKNKQQGQKNQQKKQGKKNKKGQQDQQDKKEQAKSRAQNSDKSANESKAKAAQANQKKKNKPAAKQTANERELKQLEKQWLRQIPSQPMGLLQQKFQRDYDKRHSQRQW